MPYTDVDPRLNLPLGLTEAILEAAVAMAKLTPRAFRLVRPRIPTGTTLRPGKDTPLWNELRTQLRPHLRRRGQQAQLGRVLRLPRQRINTFITGGDRMPDAERTLQLLAWLMGARQGRRPL